MERRVVCPYDCPDGCGMIATVKNGKVVAVKGDMDHPKTKGYLCRKTQHYEEMVYHPSRILYPMKRVGEKGAGEFTRISWEEAIESIVDEWKKIIEDYGPEAILPYSYAGTEGLIQSKCGEGFFHYLGASKLKRTICASGRGAGWKAIMGNSLAMPSHLFAQSDRILIWSANVAATRLHEIPYLKEAKTKGARITLIDVYETPASVFCDDVIVVKPGTDGALALGMIHIFEKEGLVDRSYIEEHVQGYERLLETLERYTPEWTEQVTGVAKETIRELALSYGRAERPTILLGSGASRRGNGAMLTRCITAIPAVLGTWKVGFGVGGLNQTATWGDISRIKRPDFDKKNARTINMMRLASALDTEITKNPPVKGLYVYHSNPLNVTTKQRQLEAVLRRADLFTVVHERFMTDTAKYADIILPAVFSLESYDVFTPYGSNSVQYSKKAVEAPGECKSNWEVFQLLAKRLGFADPYFKMTEEEACLSYLDKNHGQFKELTENEWKDLLDGKAIEKLLINPEHINTKSGKIELWNPELPEPLISYRETERCEKYPFQLVAAPSRFSLNSTFTNVERLMKQRGPMTLLISKDEGMERGICDGDMIICENEWAKVAFYAKLIDQIQPGTVVSEGIYTKEQSLNGYTINALFSEELSDLGEATTMNGNHVRIYKE